MTWLLFVGALELAWFPVSATHQYDVGLLQEGEYSVDVGVTLDGEARIMLGGAHIYAGGSLNVLMLLSPFHGWPTTLYSRTRAGLRIGVLDVGAEWLCAHPVHPWEIAPPTLWEGGRLKVFVRVGNDSLR